LIRRAGPTTDQLVPTATSEPVRGHRLACPVISTGLDAAAGVDEEQARSALTGLHSAGLPVGPCGAAAPAGVRVAATTREVVSTESIAANAGLWPRPHRLCEPDPGPDGAGESEIADYCTAWLAVRGCTTVRLKSRAGRPSAHANGAGRDDGPIMLNGQLSTQPRRLQPLDSRSSCATHTESDIWAPIWSPNDQLVIFEWILSRPTKIAGTPNKRR